MESATGGPVPLTLIDSTPYTEWGVETAVIQSRPGQYYLKQYQRVAVVLA